MMSKASTIIALALIIIFSSIFDCKASVDDIQWRMDVWEYCEFDFSELYTDLYENYPEEFIEKLKTDSKYFCNIWISGTLFLPKDIWKHNNIDYSFNLILPNSEKNGIWFSDCIYGNDPMDYVLDENDGYTPRKSLNVFIDTRIVEPSKAIELIANGLTPLLVVTKIEDHLGCSSEYTDILMKKPTFQFMKKRSINCDNIYSVKIAEIEYVPQDGTTIESQRWLDFRLENDLQSWWRVSFEIEAPTTILNMIKCIYIHSNLRDIFDVDSQNFRLYRDVEYTLDIDNGVFQASVICNDDATENEIYQQLVAAQIRIWFSFEPLRYYGSWHACASFAQ